MILDRILGLESRGGSGLVVTGAGVDQDSTLKRVFGTWGQTSSGATVNEETCMGLSAFYAGIRLLSSTPAALPLCVYRRTGEGSDKEIARDTREYAVLHDRPNPVLTPIQFREIGQMFILLWGRSLSYIERDNVGRLVGLWPLHPNDVRLSWHEGRRGYDITRVRDNELFPKPPVNKPFLYDNEVIDVASFDGKSVVGRAREQLGESLAAQAFGAGFYGGGAQPYLALISKKVLSPEATEKLILDGKLRHGGNAPLRWCVSNALTYKDTGGRRRFNKKAIREKIDLAVAMVMAVGRAMAGGVTSDSVYNSPEKEMVFI